MLTTEDNLESSLENKNTKNFIDILSASVNLENVIQLTKDQDIQTAKVFFQKDHRPYLQIAKKCFDNSSKVSFIQKFSIQYLCTHAAIMCPIRLSISHKNVFEAYYHFPVNGTLSDYICFDHEKKKSKAKALTATQKSIIAYGIAHALNYIHQQGYLFNGVTPKNVYLRFPSMLNQFLFNSQN